MLLTLLPIPTLDFSAFLAASLDGLNSLLVTGVFEDTLLDGRQYSFLPPAPHAFPVRVSTHFSSCHLLRLVPFSVFFTFPDALRHLAIACEARAEGNTS